MIQLGELMMILELHCQAHYRSQRSHGAAAATRVARDARGPTTNHRQLNDTFVRFSHGLARSMQGRFFGRGGCAGSLRLAPGHARNFAVK